MTQGAARRRFVALWLALLAAKAVLAAWLPVFGDEAWYWLESRHPAWAYSDIPGATAWSIAVGTALLGDGPAGLRGPFLAMAALASWRVVGIARRLGDPSGGWDGATVALLVPLFAGLGVLALPDVPLTLATLLCFHALLRLRERVQAAAVAELALGLVLGALSHHRFVLLLGAGAVAVLADPLLRARLRHPGVLAALAAGVLAWWPLMAFERAHAAAGLRFQFVERHPWDFQPEALLQPLQQAVLVTPLLYGLLLWVLWRCWRNRREAAAPWRLVLAACGVLLGGLFLAGLLADRERVSFHWPLAAYLPLAAMLPMLWQALPRWLPRAALALAAAACVLLLAGMAAIGVPQGRMALAGLGFYPDNFAGWPQASAASRELLADMPPGTVVVADNFMLAAQLSLAVPAARPVHAMDHRLNVEHGRAAQLRIWGLGERAVESMRGAPLLVAVETSETPPRWRAAWYASICGRIGGWARLRTLEVDGGAKRFEFFRAPAAGGCEGPAATP